MDTFLCSYRPLVASRAGREVVARAALPPFIDGSCRREPDFQAAAPSISALCRAGKFAPRLWGGDRVAYITGQSLYNRTLGWALVALLQVVERFESHDEAAQWYCARGFQLPSNCLVAGNPPQPFELTNRHPPAEVLARVNAEDDPVRAVRLWDATYARRAEMWPVFLACKAMFLELHNPPILRRKNIEAIFGRLPGTQNPPRILDEQFEALASFTEQPSHDRAYESQAR